MVSDVNLYPYIKGRVSLANSPKANLPPLDVYAFARMPFWITDNDYENVRSGDVDVVAAVRVVFGDAAAPYAILSADVEAAVPCKTGDVVVAMGAMSVDVDVLKVDGTNTQITLVCGAARGDVELVAYADLSVALGGESSAGSDFLLGGESTAVRRCRLNTSG